MLQLCAAVTVCPRASRRPEEVALLAAVVAASLFLNCGSSGVLLISVAVSGCPLAGQFCRVLKVIPGGYFSSPSSNFIDT